MPTLERLMCGVQLRNGTLEPIKPPTLLAAALLALVGCASSDSVPSSTTTSIAETSTSLSTATLATPNTALPSGFQSITTNDGQVRTFRVVDLSDGEPAPLLFVLHGFGGTAAAMGDYTGVESLLESLIDGGAIVVYPNGTGAEESLPQSWNAGGCCPFAIYDLVDDVAFFDQMITSLQGEFDVDPQRVWVMGYSNGGMMAYRLACELSTRVTAIGVAAGALMVDSCDPGQAVGALHLHGQLDAVVPIAGGGTAGIVFPSARDSFERLARGSGCPVTATTALCGNGAVIELRTSDGWTHDWQPEWTRLFVEFFARQ